MFFDFDDFDVRDRFYIIEEKNQKLRLFLETLPSEKRNYFEGLCGRAYIFHDSALDGLVVSNEEIATVFSAETDPTFIRSRVMQEIRNHKRNLEHIAAKSELVKCRQQPHQCESVSYDEVIELHGSLYHNISRKLPGQLRKIIPLHSAYFHQFAQPSDVSQKLIELCGQTEHPEFRAQHPVNQAVLFHNKFMEVMPFLVGSGKTARLFMNGFLLQGNYDLAIVHGSERQKYYETLRDGPESFRELLLDSMESSLDAQTKFIKENEFPTVTRRVYMNTIGLQ